MRNRAASWLRSPAGGVALALTAIGLVGVYLGRHDKLREWAPHIAVTAFALAITITVVQWIVTREARRRIRPRLERVIYWMGLSFGGFINALAVDYAGTHSASFREIPDNAVDMIELWLAERDNEDRIRHPLEGERLPMLVIEGREFARILEEARSRDLDILEPELVRAIDDFGWHVGQGIQFYQFAESGLGDTAGNERTGLTTVVQGALQFATVFQGIDAKWMTIQQLAKDAMREHSQHAQSSARPAPKRVG